MPLASLTTAQTDPIFEGYLYPLNGVHCKHSHIDPGALSSHLRLALWHQTTFGKQIVLVKVVLLRCCLCGGSERLINLRTAATLSLQGTSWAAWLDTLYSGLLS